MPKLPEGGRRTRVALLNFELLEVGVKRVWFATCEENNKFEEQIGSGAQP